MNTATAELDHGHIIAAFEAEPEIEHDPIEAEVIAQAADADSAVRDNLYADLRAARTEVEHHAIQALIESRHWWLAAHFRDAATGAAEPSYWAQQADRQWAIVAAERAKPGYAELSPWVDPAFLDAIAF